MVHTDWIAVVLMVSAVVFFILSLKTKGKFKTVAENALAVIGGMLNDYIMQAENKYSSEQYPGRKMGDAKKSMVIGLITNSPFYASLPDEVRKIVSVAAIGVLIDAAVDKWLRPVLKEIEK